MSALPIDRLRDGSMTDGEAVTVAASTIRNMVEPNWPASGKQALRDLADRLELVRLLDPRQTRAYSTVRASAAGLGEAQEGKP